MPTKYDALSNRLHGYWTTEASADDYFDFLKSVDANNQETVWRDTPLTQRNKVKEYAVGLDTKKYIESLSTIEKDIRKQLWQEMPKDKKKEIQAILKTQRKDYDFDTRGKYLLYRNFVVGFWESSGEETGWKDYSSEKEKFLRKKK